MHVPGKKICIGVLLASGVTPMDPQPENHFTRVVRQAVASATACLKCGNNVPEEPPESEFTPLEEDDHVMYKPHPPRLAAKSAWVQNP